ncbi:Uncharacterised protein [Staphylococcus aureus]|uniref:Uncharacterized protein n=1 Tax=Staphylococcus aureus TaxID=1280 RepID=A0A380DQP9_STAAU|nr:Uncharacterised protein [Staphylococcus aureus]
MQQEERVANDILHVAVKGKRKRNYKKGTTYIPPKPHLRPAFDRGKEKFENNIKKFVEGE